MQSNELECLEFIYRSSSSGVLQVNFPLVAPFWAHYWMIWHLCSVVGTKQVISMKYDPNRSSFDYSCEKEKSMVVHPQIDLMFFTEIICLAPSTIQLKPTMETPHGWSSFRNSEGAGSFIDTSWTVFRDCSFCQ